MPVARAGTISSLRNPFLQDVRRALRRGEPTEQGFLAIEGVHLLEEARRSSIEIAATIGGESVGDIPHYDVPDSVLAGVATTETSPGVIALVRMPNWREADLKKGTSLTVVLDGLQDPGNAGTILRSTEAFGATGVVFRPGTVSPFNAKLIRASAGSIFRIPFLSGPVDLDLPLYAAQPHAGKLVSDVDWTRPCAIAIGSEAHGIRPELTARATLVRIPTSGVESLNAAVSASIILYEASRQRSAR